MKPKQIWCNLAVQDSERTGKFYADLGFRSSGSSAELVSFFFGDSPLVIHFFQKEVLERNIAVDMAGPSDRREAVFTLSAKSREEVNQWQMEVEKAGGNIISRAAAFGDGYYGFVFADPHAHTFNVFYM